MKHSIYEVIYFETLKLVTMKLYKITFQSIGISEKKNRYTSTNNSKTYQLTAF